MQFYETRMGRIFFEHQFPQLIKAVNELTAALSRPAPTVGLPVAADPKFLDSLFFGGYEPEIYQVTPESQRLGRAVILAYDALTETLSEESKERLSAYEAALSERNTAVSELAYESGVRAAVQMIVAGLSRPVVPQSDKTTESEETDQNG